MVDADRMVERRRLYEARLNDTDIAAQTGVTAVCIFRWRERQGLPPNLTSGKYVRAAAAINMELYKRGLSDQEIAKQRGITPTPIAGWRRRLGLPANGRTQSSAAQSDKAKKQHVAPVRRQAVDKDRRRELYDYGLIDRKIAEKVGLSIAAIQSWRQRENLPRHPIKNALSKEKERDRLTLYRLGWSDLRISKELGVYPRTIGLWRKSRGLPAKHKPRQGSRPVMISVEAEEQRIRLHRAGKTDSEIAREVGRSVYAIWAWRQKRGLQANKKERHWDRPATTVVSMDADLGEGGFNRHALIADDAAGEWLERMGATVW